MARRLLWERPDGAPGPRDSALAVAYRLRQTPTTEAKDELAHFYNPTGDGVFPEGSPYGAGLPIPKALNIMVTAQWVPTWWERELDDIIPAVKSMIEPKVGGFLLILTDGPTLGTPATPADLGLLMYDHAVDYPGALDPNKETLTTMLVAAYPSNILVRTADMTIVEVIGGTPGPDSSYWETFASVLSEMP